MRLHRRPPEDPEPPLGVVLHLRGEAIGCAVLRDEDADEGGCAAWVAVPDEPVAILPGEPYSVTAAVLPERTVLIADFARDVHWA